MLEWMDLGPNRGGGNRLEMVLGWSTLVIFVD